MAAIIAAHVNLRRVQENNLRAYHQRQHNQQCYNDGSIDGSHDSGSIAPNPHVHETPSEYKVDIVDPLKQEELRKQRHDEYQIKLAELEDEYKQELEQAQIRDQQEYDEALKIVSAHTNHRKFPHRFIPHAIKKYYMNASQLEALEKQRQIVKEKPRSERREKYTNALDDINYYKQNQNRGKHEMWAAVHHRHKINQLFYQYH
jgi:hypothetical protein